MGTMKWMGLGIVAAASGAALAWAGSPALGAVGGVVGGTLIAVAAMEWWVTSADAARKGGSHKDRD